MSMNNEPQAVAEVGADEHGDMTIRAIVPLPIGAKLYAAPVAAAPVDLDAHGLRALDNCIVDLRRLLELADDFALDEMQIQSLLTAIDSMELRKRGALSAAPVVDPSRLGAAMTAFYDAGGHAVSYAPAWMRKALEAASTPAAPGIDLEQFRPFVELERGFIANRIDRCDAIGTGERLTVLQAELANADRLLRLIDDSRLIDASPKGGIDACAWAGDGEGNWHTACGEIFTLMEGTPTDNKMRHCPYCGKNLRATSADVCVAVISASYEDTRSEARDAARYRWLRNHYEPSFHDSECDSLIGLHGEDLDDAIDDEMQATSAEVGVSTFKIGDRICIIDTDYDTSEDVNLSNGQTGYVIKILDGGVTIQTDAGPRNRNGKDGWCFFDEQLELIPNEQQPTSHGAGVSE